jgi:short-subunit dehydrogenase
MAYSLITGASGGIGLAIAKELAARKHDVLLVARSENQLRQHAAELSSTFGVKTDYLAIDLASPGSALKVQEWLSQKNYGVDVLINNAGYGLWGKFQDLSRDELNAMMQLNMITMADFCKVMLPLLQKNTKAYLLNVSSTSAYQAVPAMSTYAATKAFVLLFTRGLHLELKGSSVSVSCLCPGTTSTGFNDRARLSDRIKATAEKFTMEPEVVAKKAVDGLFAGKMEIIPGFTNWISAKMSEILPKSIPEKIAAGIYKTDK